jgi:hypothetical protein
MPLEAAPDSTPYTRPTGCRGVAVLAPTTTPDGAFVNFLQRVGTQESELWQLTHFPADGQQIWAGRRSADGKRLAVARAAVANNMVLFRGFTKRP